MTCSSFSISMTLYLELPVGDDRLSTISNHSALTPGKRDTQLVIWKGEFTQIKRMCDETKINQPSTPGGFQLPERSTKVRAELQLHVYVKAVTG